MLDEIQRFRTFNQLKTVYRYNTVGDRKESSAEHTWSALVLADLFLTHNPRGLDKLKVFELLMYHDAVEIIAGDVPLHPDVMREDKTEKEALAAQKLATQIPALLKEKYLALHEEYVAQETREAQFAKIVDFLDAQIHELDYKKDWKGYTREFLVEHKGYVFEEFPDLKELFYELLNYCEEHEYFSQ